MTTALLGLLLSQQLSISLEAGYYTVGEAASQIASQGVRIQAEGPCAGDIYALRTDRVRWEELRSALQRDGRLTIRESNGTWRISRSAADANRESSALKRYLASAAKPIHLVYSETERILRRLQAMPEADRSQFAVSELDDVSSDPAKTAVKTLVYLNTGRELPFGLVASTALFTAPQAPPRFSQYVGGTLFQYPALFFASGSIRELRMPGTNFERLTDPELAEFARRTSLSLKLALDPVTLACVARMAALGGVGSTHLISASSQEVSSSIKIEIAPSQVWSKDELAEQDRRVKITEVLLNSKELAVDAELPPRPISTSEALLRSAIKRKSNLVCYVSPLTDFIQTQIKSAADAIECRNPDPEWFKSVVAERAEGAYLRQFKLPLAPQRRYTAEMDGSVLVVRDEARFIGGFANAPAGPPTSLLNADLEGKLGSADTLIEAVAKLNLAPWTTSCFSSTYLRFCNPLSFRPFAKALQKSPVLRARIAEVPEGRVATIPYAELEPSAIAALHQAILEGAPHNDAGHMWGDPAVIQVILSPRNGQDPKIRLEKREGKLELRVMLDGEARWRSWVKGIDFSVPR